MKNIHLKRQGLAAEALYFLCEPGARGHIAQAEGDVRPRMSQRKRDGATQTASRAGDQGDLAS